MEINNDFVLFCILFCIWCVCGGWIARVIYEKFDEDAKGFIAFVFIFFIVFTLAISKALIFLLQG